MVLIALKPECFFIILTYINYYFLQFKPNNFSSKILMQRLKYISHQSFFNGKILGAFNYKNLKISIER